MSAPPTETPRRNDFPNIDERARRMGDLIASPALPLADVSLFLDCPLSTLDMLRTKGQGPRTFRIGRRLYVRQVDLRAWLDKMAETEVA
jgi:hypothetical protein